MDIDESIYKFVVEPSYKNLPGQMSTVMVTAVIREENPPRHRLTPLWVRALESAENDMWIPHWVNLKPVSFISPGIILMNVMSRNNLVLITLKLSILRTTGIISYQGKKLTGSRKIMLVLIMWGMKSY